MGVCAFFKPYIAFLLKTLLNQPGFYRLDGVVMGQKGYKFIRNAKVQRPIFD